MTLQEKVLTPLPDDECDIWVFGFGSLVHHPGFAYEERVEGFIRGWRRVFWQGSTDHRGVPEKPGRTVTLVEDSSSITVRASASASTPRRASRPQHCCRRRPPPLRARSPAGPRPLTSPARPPPPPVQWGAAYRLVGSRAEQQRTLQYLEWREKQYDRRVWVAVHRLGAAAGDPPAVAQALTFVATNDRCAAGGWELAGWLPWAGWLAGGRLRLCLGWRDRSRAHARAARSALLCSPVHEHPGRPPPRPRRRAANPNYLGPASEEAIAAQVAAAAGPSGPNRDYVFRLADAMRTMGVDDPDLFSLEARVRALVAEQAAAGVGVAAGVGAAEGAAAEDAGCATEGQQPQQQPPPPVPA